MFGIPTPWLIAGGFALLFAGTVWHESKIEWMKADILARERARVALASEELQRTEALRAAYIAAQSDREAAELEESMAVKDRELEGANLKIAELEKANTKCGFVSRETVRAINRGR